jgi:hypothetical protein
VIQPRRALGESSRAAKQRRCERVDPQKLSMHGDDSLMRMARTHILATTAANTMV